MEHLEVKDDLSRLQRIALFLGVVGAAATAYAFTADKGIFYQSYLMAFLYWFGLAGGALALLCIHHLVAGRWGFVIQRPLEAAAKTMPLMALFFIPLVFGIHSLYEWSHAEVVAHDHVLQAKAAYLNEKGFMLRGAFFFVVWTLLAYTLSAWSNRQDKEQDPARLNERIRTLSGPGLVVYVLTVSFAAIDWGMSLTPHWFSTMYAPMYLAGTGIMIFALMAIVANRLSHHKPLHHHVTHQQFHDIGNLLFAFTVLWTYTAIGEYIIIWSGNIPEETEWFLHRAHGGWKLVAAFLFVFQFLVPFFILLNKPMKRHGAVLARIAAWVLLCRYAGIFWMVAPTFRDQVQFHWQDFAVWLGMGGVWAYVFLALLKSKPLLPDGDPRWKAKMAVHVVGH